MYIGLPTKTDGLAGLVSTIDSSKIQQLHFLPAEIEVSIPKFKILNTIKLNEILKSVSVELFVGFSHLIYIFIFYTLTSLEFVNYLLHQHRFRSSPVDR